MDGVIAPSRGWLSPARALLLLLGAVLGGVLLSLALGASPAHAADGDGTSSGSSPLTAAAQSVSRAVVVSVSATTGAGIPAFERTAQHAIPHMMDASAATVVAAISPAAPVIAPAVASAESTLAGALSATARGLQQLTAPIAGALDPFDAAVVAPRAAATVGAMRPSSAGADPDGMAAMATRPAAQGGSGANGAVPGSLVSSGTSAPFAAVGVLLAAVALVLLAARRRILQNALPASPVFDTDTSPA